MAENESNQEQPNKAMGCGGIAAIVVNLGITISVIRHMSGFWYCTGAFLLFEIAGLIGGALGMAIGMAVAKSQDANNAAKQIGFAIVGLLIGLTVADVAIGKLIYGINIISLIQK